MKSIYSMLFVSTLAAAVSMAAHANEPDDWVKAAALKEEPAVIALRHQIHQHPELGNQEFETSKLVAQQLKALGIEVRTQVANTGVVGVLKGGKPGPVMALRADMDALPVQEPAGLAFASTAKALYQGKEVPVMHACGHDAHTAILLGAAKLLADHRDQIAGTVVFVFQPAEEGGANIDNFTQGAEIGARKMIAEGVLDNPKVEVIFGLHVMAGIPSGQIRYKSGAILSSADGLRITVNGRCMVRCHGRARIRWLPVRR
jgi:amidohydrolase